MITSIAAPHAKGKSAQDNIFGANAAAVAAAAKYGVDKVTNATIGAILDEEEKLVCLPTVEKVLRGLCQPMSLLHMHRFLDYRVIWRAYLTQLLALPARRDILTQWQLPAVPAFFITLFGIICQRVIPPLPLTGTGVRIKLFAEIWKDPWILIKC